MFSIGRERAQSEKDAITYLNEHVAEFIEPENWFPDNHDLNPVDFWIWENLMQQILRDVACLRDILLNA